MIPKSYCTGYVLRNYQIRFCQEGSKKLRAPWWGGFYESDIVTMVTEVEAVLNSRPLTYLYPDIEDNQTLDPKNSDPLGVSKTQTLKSQTPIF